MELNEAIFKVHEVTKGRYILDENDLSGLYRLLCEIDIIQCKDVLESVPMCGGVKFFSINS